MNRLATPKRSTVLAALAEGTSINATCRMTGVAKHPVLKLLTDLGCAAAAVALYFMHYNFCRVHKSLRVTPAMEAGVTNHVWTLEEPLRIGE